MRIFHVLFSDARGGLEQAFVNATEALNHRGHEVIALIHPNAPFRPQLEPIAKAIHTATPRGFYDLLAVLRIRGMLKRHRPQMILAHNGRAIALMRLAAKGLAIPVCGLSHSYKPKRALKADALVVLTEHMRMHFMQLGYPGERLHVVPNFIHVPKTPPQSKPVNYPPVIGLLGRLVAEKGQTNLLYGLAALKRRNVPFRARLGGVGRNLEPLHALIAELDLVQEVQVDGWVDDRTDFYRSLDIFCLPATQESFGIVVLEAMAAGIPIVACNIEGPASILTDNVNGLLVSPYDADAIAAALSRIIQEPGLGERFAAAAWKRLQDYDFPTVAMEWDKAVCCIIQQAPIRQAA